MLQAYMKEFESKPFNFENQYLRSSIVGVMVIQANANIDSETKQTSWAQLVAQYKTIYSRTDTHGEIVADNASIKKLVIKFPKSYLDENKITSDEFKKYFDQNVVGKHMIYLPVSAEKQSYSGQGEKRTALKDQSECTIDESFDLKALIDGSQSKKSDKAS